MAKTSFTVGEAWPAVAIGAGLYVAVKLVGNLTKSDGPTPEQDAAREQTNGGSPVENPGDRLVGESDYIKVYKGQKIDALQRFGESPLSPNNIAYPVTTRAYARDSICAYWTREITRLTGVTIAIDDLSPADYADSVWIPDWLNGDTGLVGRDAGHAMLASWDNLHVDLLTELHGQDPLSAEGTVRFWDCISKLSILVDVDRAVPDATGENWARVYEAAKSAGGAAGDAVERVTKEAAGALWKVALAATLNIALSPLGLALIGASIYLYRGELAALSRRF